MMKKMTSLLLAVLLLMCLVLPVGANSVSHIADDAGLLYFEEIAALEEKAAGLYATYGIDAVILTIDSLGGVSAQDYADDYYDHNGYSEDGVLFLLAMEEREWYISTCGTVIYALTDYGIQQLGEGVLPYLSAGSWYDGFDFFLDRLPYFLDAYGAGTPVDGYADYSGDYYHGQQDGVVYYPQEKEPSFLLSLLIGLAVGGIAIAVMRTMMNTKRAQRSASAYMKEGSWNLSMYRDIFLYSNVSKTRRQQSSSSGGGSSVHRSSGGRSHGGGGGRF